MEQRLTFITLGVSDLAGMTTFYKEKFGWEPMKEMDGITFFRLNGIVFALFPVDELRADAGTVPEGSGWKQMSLSINFTSADDVDREIGVLRSKGVRVLKEPQQVFWGGYHAYVEDPESNLWELAYNPFLEMDRNGNVLGHQ